MLNLFKIEVQLIREGMFEPIDVVFYGDTIEKVEDDYDFSMDDRYSDMIVLEYAEFYRESEDAVMWSKVEFDDMKGQSRKEPTF